MARDGGDPQSARMNAPQERLPALPLYQRIAEQIDAAIDTGALKSGDRLPSVRQLSEQHRVSMATAVAAYRVLEDRLRIEARPKSGYYVTAPLPQRPAPSFDATLPPAEPLEDRLDALVREFIEVVDDASAAPSFCARPARRLVPEARLQHLMATINRRHPEYLTHYHIAGSAALKHEIARRAVAYGAQIRDSEIVITSGGMESATLALLACTEPGDTVAVESPAYFLLLQMIANLGRKAIEIPTHPSEGMSIEALDLATQRPGAVKAVALLPNFSNPLGCLMPEANKRRLAALAAERDFTVIENDIYGDAAHGAHRPPVLQGFDHAGRVILCSAFTKILAPGLRVGWIAPGPRWFSRVQLLKLRTSMAVQMQPQEAIAAFMHDGGYDHHLRRLRASLRDQVRQMADAVARWFPSGCAFSLPQGGFLLWVELPRQVDSIAVFQAAKAARVGAAPGAVFSATRRYDHCIRLQCGDPWSSAIEAGVRTLGTIIDRQLQRSG
jgi:DNA-binding transcriptional MocR family regulator